MHRIAVMGAGGWGTALSIVAGRRGHDVRLWSRSARVVEEIERGRVNSVYLAPHEIPPNVSATLDTREALRGAQIVILAAPSHATRELLTRLRESIEAGMIFVSATKGVEVETGKRISEIVSDVLVEERAATSFVCLSGPSFAQEVAAGQPTAVAAASDDAHASRLVQTQLSTQSFRIYTNDDVVGTETGGALKNVMALAAGMVAGLGLGTNSVAALVTRGLAEMTRLAVAQGGRVETLTGLAGLGDLVLTCTGGLSRNRFVGQELGRGRSLSDVLAAMTEVAEGVRTTRAVKLLAARLGVEMPITNEVHAVLYEGKSVREAAGELMSRPLRGESEAIGV
ncbi:MAG TPA: NAD(P)H-dependent glycerol-3-phosphate dehydrogenase [Pyrinomonadaceae bacterium]|nr:NAD(P)H-dependent glycerol-3-phosphate dehydrogenase [Pyrinomonadaceae bacterium]